MMVLQKGSDKGMQNISPSPGTLYICGTPIGHLEDVSIRLLKTLRRVDLIACEDTRHTVRLLNRYKIKKRLISYHEHSPVQREDQLLTWLQEGKNLAVVSDAGMPVISDPGNRLIARAQALEIPVEVIPGPSACIAALVLSGLPGSPFIFMGFAPEKKSARKDFFSDFQEESRTVIFYEAPHRLRASLQDLRAVLGEQRPVAVVKEITKKFQDVRFGSAQTICDYYSQHEPRGEFCVLIGGYTPDPPTRSLQEIVVETQALIASGVNKKDAIRQQAKTYGLQKSVLYKQFFSENDR